jgi:hypothetical protein
VSTNPFAGKWTYRSLLNDPDINQDFDKLEFGRGTLDIEETAPTIVKGTIGGPGWSLLLHGSVGFGSPMQVRFQGKGLVNGEQWVYDYLGWLVPAWPNSDSTLQRAAIVGSVVRTVPHSSGGGVAPAGVVASFYAVRNEASPQTAG